MADIEHRALTPDEPDGAPRLPVLDILRGVAILAILFMNINDMGGPLNLAGPGGDIRRLGWTGADQVAWWAREVFANGTARCLLELLFGAGMAILTDRAATGMSGARVLRAYAWRNVVLFAFGLLHVFVLLWPGDILHTYAIAALIAVLFRRLRPRLLLTVGLVLAMLQLVGGGLAAIDARHDRAEVARIEARQRGGTAPDAAGRARLAAFAKGQAEQARTRAETAARVAAEDRARGADATARSWAGSAWETFAFVEAQLLELAFVWEAAGTMLIGAALFRWGVLQGARNRRFYATLTAVAYGVGLTCRAWAAWADTRFDDVASLAFATAEAARLLTTLGHVGAINLLLFTPLGARALRPFAAAGRTALSIYVAHTLVCLWVIYPPWGFGLYGRQGWAALMATALAVDAMLLAAAVWWVRRFAIAPVEWAWRSAVAGRRLGWR